MLISHQFQFIFVKTGKTAGTSIEVELSRQMADDDVATPIYPPVQGHKPRNFVFHRGLFGLWELKAYNHIAARKIKTLVGREKFNTYFKFCVEREPVDKCISHFSMLRNSPHHSNKEEPITWEQYLSWGKFPVDTHQYTDRFGRLLVDSILKFENLENDLRDVARKQGFSFTGLSIKEKSGFRQTVDVTETQRALIYRAFESSNRFTGYSMS